MENYTGSIGEVLRGPGVLNVERSKDKSFLRTRISNYEVYFVF